MGQAGADVVVAARNKAKTQDAVNQLLDLGVRALGVTANVTDETSVTTMVRTTLEEFGGINILVNNAGIGIRKPPQDYTLQEWEQVVDVNLTGTFLCSREVYPHMAEAGGGKIINIGSMTSIFGSDWVAAYSASKGGVVQLTRSLAIAWAKDNIQVNAILPGWIHTDLTAPIKTDFPERYDFIKSRIPHGRWASRRKWAVPPSFSPAAPLTMLPASPFLWTADIRRSRRSDSGASPPWFQLPLTTPPRIYVY